ncbi:MAG TPA: pseudouridine synthase [Cyclobacteriaceae bacterium]|nr:pseudouridine synthase [Cyclobacteriaceae bacterium]
MARNNRFNNASGSGRDHQGKNNRRGRDAGKRDTQSKRSGSFPERKSAGPKKDFRKRDETKPDARDSQSRNQRPKASPFYKDRGYGSPERREPKPDGERKSFRKPKSPSAYRSQESAPFKPKEKKSFIESRLDKQRKTRHVSPETAPKDDGLIRLNKFISNSGVCSRREADELIANGLITVNGKTITELGHKVKPTDDVRHDGKKLKAEKPVYILINKPKGYITTTDDPQERNTVMKLIEGACKERVYPVGRLDRNTSGLLLLTNDGELTDKLSHPRNNVKKIYKAELDKPLTKADFQKILDGIHLEEGRAMVDDLAIVSEDGKTIGIELHIGWNRIIRRIFETLGYEVVKLDRSVYAGLDKKELQRGHWRFLRPDEIIRLKHFQ